MALCPFAVHKIINPGSNDPKITARAICLHVAVSEASSLYDYFNGPSGGIESHFYIQRDGGIEQYRDTAYQADAQYDANDFAISFESQGMGDGEWTDAQIASIKKLILWCHSEHPDIQLQKIQNWNGSGIGYHAQFFEWDRSGHSCPGPDRVKQYDNIIVPWLNAGAQEGTDLQLNDDIYRDKDKTVTVRDLFIALDRFINNSAARDKALKDQITSLLKAVDQNADKAEIKDMLEHLDATIQLVVTPDSPVNPGATS